MPESSKRPPDKNQRKEPNIIGRICIDIIRALTNLFWQVVDTLSYRSVKIAKLYSQSIGKEYLSEYRLLGVQKDKKILHIGCGPYPLTEISLAEQFGAQVVGIDKNQNILKMARDVVIERALDTQITIKHGNGISYPMKDFDVIIISSCASPKKEILENIFHQAKKDCIVIVRELDIATANINTTINKHKNIEIIKRSHHHPIPLLLQIPWTSISLRVK